MFDKRQVQWLDHVPDLDSLFIEIASPKGRAGFKAVILQPELQLVNTHHVDNRTIPCTGDECVCQVRKGMGNPRTKAYLQGWFPSDGLMCLIELTLFSLKCYKDHHGGDPNFMRGQVIHVFRLTDGDRAPVNFKLSPTVQHFENMPLRFSVEDALVKIWNGENRPEPRRTIARRRA